MHLIWQHSRRDKSDHTAQLLLTIGNTLVESNYRVRVLAAANATATVKFRARNQRRIFDVAGFLNYQTTYLGG